MTTHVVTNHAEKVVAVAETYDEAERLALQLAIASGRAATVTESPLSLENARLRAKLCPECGSPNVKFGYRANNWDPGDADPSADCNDCGWGY